MTFPPLGNSDHVVSVSIDFPSNSQCDVLFYHIGYYYSCGDCDGLGEHLRGALWEDIFKLSASAASSEFCYWLKLMYVSLIVSIRSSLTYLLGFQLLVHLL